MHDTALFAGRAFAQAYGRPGCNVVDIGGLDMNGSLRGVFERMEMKYTCVDMDAHPSVDLVVSPGDSMPFPDGSVDLVVSTSCFEHDPCFWITIREMARITKLGGFVYVNAPSSGPYHGCPGDNWRFYRDAGQALAYWTCRKLSSHESLHPLKVIETFHIGASEWTDFVCIWQRTEDVTTDIKLNSPALTLVGPAREIIATRFPIQEPRDWPASKS